MSRLTLDWNKYRQTAVNAACEGAVLLKNDRNVLPVKTGASVAVFGRMQSNYYKSGTGSGGMVNTGHVTDIFEGLSNDPDIKVDLELKKIYEEWEAVNPVDPGVGWGNERWSQDEMPLSDETVRSAAGRCDVAIIVIARTAGEDRDNTKDKGSYYLTEGEEDMLRKVCADFDKTIVLLNTGNIIDMSFVEKFDPSAVMYVWQAGVIGGVAVADLVTGKAVPSGCLTDTIAKDLNDYPSTADFGAGDKLRDLYREDVFVGYRYFSTFAPEKVLYPFGFGLSYTEFAFSDILLENEGTDVKVTLKVKNTGKTEGKKTVMLFAKAPAGAICKPAMVLVAFTKTKLLFPGEECTVSLSATADRFASFDDDGRAGLGTGWILEKGEYVFFAGSNVSDNEIAGSFTLDNNILLESLENALAPVEPFERMIIGEDGAPAYEPVPLRDKDYLKTRGERIPEEIPQTGDRGIKLIDVKNGKNTMDEFVAQMSDEDLALIIRGEGMSSPKVTTGTAAAYCGISKELKEMGIPTVCCDDGPSGMRLDSGKKAFAMPNGTCLACSFNEELMEELFSYFGMEMMSNMVDVILGPGINIHRNPLNGRNFEYFSEDPLVTGRIACAQLKGLHKYPVTATIKHFCANNRETRRREMDSVVSGRALREIYLKPFEIAVKEGGARSIMTVYNRINGTYGTSNYDLGTMVLREQWGFKGLLMTDWWAFINEVPSDPYSRGLTEHSIMARAQCDVYMVCSAVERENLYESDTYENIKAGRTDLVTRAELQRNAKNICGFAMNTYAMERLLGKADEIVHEDCPFADDTIEAKVDVYYDILKQPVVEVDVDTSEGRDFVFGVTCDKPGRYRVKMTGSSPLGALAQIPMTVYYTSIPIRVFTWNGTEGRDVTKDETLLFLSKYTIFRAHFGANGFRLKRLEFEFEHAVEEDDLSEF